MKMRVTGLIPSRFLTLTAHLVILIILLIDRGENVKACLPMEYSTIEYNKKDGELLESLPSDVPLLTIEFSGFLDEVLQFRAVLADYWPIACHSSAAVSLSFMILDVWDCNIYWWIFTLCSIIPTLNECGVMVKVLMLKKHV
ncbi:unnamed protein product, partial [Meganyctiphanes norvegica]